MIQLLSTVVFLEGMVALLLMTNIRPLRKLVMKGLDRAKANKGPAMIKTLAGAMLVILLSSITSILKIQKRSVMVGTITPTDQVLSRTHLLEAYLMGFALFLGLVIDRLHHFLRELASLRSSTGSLKKQAQSPQAILKEDKEHGSVNELTVLQDEIAELRQKLRKLTLDSEAMENEAKEVEAKTKSLQKQAEGFLLKYDHLLEDNQNLQNDTSSNSDSKKDA